MAGNYYPYNSSDSESDYESELGAQIDRLYSQVVDCFQGVKSLFFDLPPIFSKNSHFFLFWGSFKISSNQPREKSARIFR